MAVACVLFATSIVAAALPAPDDLVAIDLRVRVPKDTPANAKLYLAGNLESVGRWRADGVPLVRGKDGRYRAKLILAGGALLEYKITRGSWETVEKSATGAEIPNRRLVADEDATVEITVERWAGGEAGPNRSTRTGDIRFHERFRSRHLNNERTMVVYLPPGYATDVDQRYPVLYMHDGQNLFDAATSFIGVEWQVDETAERLIRAGRIRSIIIVGIYNNAERMSEYTPTVDKDRKAGGRGERYARFLVEEVKPFIDASYRTRPGRGDTAVAGSSLGGLISLYIATSYVDKFSMCGVISPALMWDDGQLLSALEANPAPLKRLRIWLDMGSKEGDQVEGFGTTLKQTRRLAGLLDGLGRIEGRDYRYLEVKGGLHNEAAWAARFDGVLLFFFGT